MSKKNQPNFVKDLSIGAFSGGVVSFATYTAEFYGKNHHQFVYKKIGFSNYLNQNLRNILLPMLPVSCNFAFKELFKQFLPSFDPQNQFVKFSMVQFFCGGLAGATYTSLYHPLNFLRNNSDTKKKIGLEKYFRGYKGLGLSLSTIIPYRATFFGFYDSFREKNQHKNDLGMKGILKKYLIAQISVILAIKAQTPFIIMNSQLHYQRSKDSKITYREVFNNTFNRCGLIGMFRGGISRYCIPPAFTLVLFDQIQGFLSK